MQHLSLRHLEHAAGMLQYTTATRSSTVQSQPASTFTSANTAWLRFSCIQQVCFFCSLARCIPSVWCQWWCCWRSCCSCCLPIGCLVSKPRQQLRQLPLGPPYAAANVPGHAKQSRATRVVRVESLRHHVITDMLRVPSKAMQRSAAPH